MTYIEPLFPFFLAILLGGLAMRWRNGRKVAIAGIVGLILISWPPVDWLLAQPLVARYPMQPFVPPPNLQAVVVLSSTLRPAERQRPYPLPDMETFDRCAQAAWIYRQYGPLPVVACQGSQKVYAEVMRDLLRRAGVADDMIWTERQSRSTHENAVFGGRILRAHGIERIALVVDAQSMPRAAACFRKEGFDVTPAPVEMRSWGPWQQEVLPNWRAVRRNEITLHEMLGLVWYRLNGWI